MRLRRLLAATTICVVALVTAAPVAHAATGPSVVITSPTSDLTFSGRALGIGVIATAGSGSFLVEAGVTVNGRAFARYNYQGSARTSASLSTAIHTIPTDQTPVESTLVTNFATLTVVAWVLDSAGRYVESEAVHVTISFPRGYLNTPHNGDALQVGEQVPWSATVLTAGDRSISKVLLYFDGTVVATDTSAPFGGTFTVPGIYPGRHPLSILVYDSSGADWNSDDPVSVSTDQARLVVSIPSGQFGLAGQQLPVSVSMTGVAAGYQPPGGVSIFVGGDPALLDVTLPWSGTITVPADTATGVYATATIAPQLEITDEAQVAPIASTTGVSLVEPSSDGLPAPQTFDALVPALHPDESPSGSFIVDGVTTIPATLQGGHFVAPNSVRAWTGTPGTHSVRFLFQGVTAPATGPIIIRKVASAITTFTIAAPHLTLLGPGPGAEVRYGDSFSTDAPDGTLVLLYAGSVPLDPPCRVVSGSSCSVFTYNSYNWGATDLHVDAIDQAGAALATSAPVNVRLVDDLPSLVGVPAGPMVEPGLLSATSFDCGCSDSLTPLSLVVDGVVHESLAAGQRFSVAPLMWSPGLHELHLRVTLKSGRVIDGADHPLTVDDLGPVPRVGGSDRYGTAAGLSASFAPVAPPVAILAAGSTFPDALAGAAAAGAYGSPVLLANSADGLPATTVAELERLKPRSTIILGGLNQVSSGDEWAAGLITDGPVLRITGRDRYQTAALLSSVLYNPGVPVVYVATGLQFPDALSGAALAGSKGVPLLMTSPTALPSSVAAELTRLKPASIVVLGGPAVVSDTVLAKLRAYTKGGVTRLYGADRYATSAAIAAQFPASVPQAFLATGVSFADALAAAAVAGGFGEPLLLTAPTGLPSPVSTQLLRLAPADVVVAGGPVSVPESVREQVVALLYPSGGTAAGQRAGTTSIPPWPSTGGLSAASVLTPWLVPLPTLMARLAHGAG